jgi:hypothetical protein
MQSGAARCLADHSRRASTSKDIHAVACVQSEHRTVFITAGLAMHARATRCLADHSRRASTGKDTDTLPRVLRKNRAVFVTTGHAMDSVACGRRTSHGRQVCLIATIETPDVVYTQILSF